MATATKTTGFGTTCPHCHEDSETITLNLNNLDELRCMGCDATFSAAEARDLVAAELARWDAVVRMVELARELATTL